MKKQLLFLALSSTVSLSALALSQNSVFDGFYGGVMGGVIRTTAQDSVSSSAAYSTPFEDDHSLSSSDQKKQKKNSGVGELYFGYGQFVNNSRFYLAGEVFGDFAKRNPTALSTSASASYDDEDGASTASLMTNTQAKLNSSEFGVDLRPGYLVATNTLLYGRIGAAFNKISLSTNNAFSYTGNGGGTSVSYEELLPLAASKNAVGLRLGLGLEHYLGNNFSATFDYIYTYYGKVNASGTVDRAGTDPVSLTSQSSTRVSTQTAMLGIKYYFPVNNRAK